MTVLSPLEELVAEQGRLTDTFAETGDLLIARQLSDICKQIVPLLDAETETRS